MIQLRKRYTEPFDIFNYMISDLLDPDLGKKVDGAALQSRVDVQNENYSLTLEVPGFDESEIDIEVHDGLLYIRAEHDEKSEHQHFYKKVNRSWTIPKDVKSEEIQAKLKNGILTVLIPRTGLSEPKKVKLLLE